MTTQLNFADLLILRAAAVKGPFNPPGTDTLSLLGLRTIDGTQNNLTHDIIIDQYGHLVNTDTFANVDQPFFHFADTALDGTPLLLAEAGFLANGDRALIGDTAGTWYHGISYNAGTMTATDQMINYAPGLNVQDDSPRLITTMIADMSSANPATATADIIGNPGNQTLNILPTNALFTFFGQFFDHGLDFINKGGSGVVTGDHLIMNRATLTDPNDPGVILNTSDGVVINSTAPLVEQSQSYGQRASTTFYLMEYSDGTFVTGHGVMVPAGEQTGRLVTHVDGTMATWADIKANALLKGIILQDIDALNIPDPALIDDPAYFNSGTMEWVRDANGVALAGTGQAMIADIAHTAVPADMTGMALMPENDGIIGDGFTPPAAGFYDNELFEAHKVAGDGRANENVALTSIHQAFHGEHNRLVLQLEDLIAQGELLTPGFADQFDGTYIFEAAKFVNEMQYQHFVFEEFARRLSPNIDAFAAYDVTINPNISLEFSQAVYRLGHSMLTDSVNSIGADGQFESRTLVDAFLNPLAFDEAGGAALIEGQTQQAMNLIDEFVVDSVRNLLLGLELDLGAINIARGRDVGLPTLNQTRLDLFEQTGLSQLAPYTSWTDFGNNLLHSESLVNFIAAYAERDGGLGEAVVDAREALVEAEHIGTETDVQNAQAALRAAAAVAMADTGGFMLSNQGFWNIDLWIGGLAEAKVQPNLLAPTSVGMLGSTFDFIFATQLLSLQNGDRLYYLARLPLNILDEVEGKKFSELFERGTGATHIGGDAFGVYDQTIELADFNNGTHTFTTTHAINDPFAEIVGGTTLADTISTGAGNDTVYGEDGNDIISTGAGADIIFGGDGNDTINGGDNNDFIRGDAGNDTIDGGAGDDIIFANDGNDTVNGGQGFDEVFGGLGNDIINGGDQDDALFGNEHNDVLRGGLGDDALDGGEHHDALFGDQGADTLIGGLGNNVLIGGAGGDTLDGTFGTYDLAAYLGGTGITIDMNGAISTGNALGDVFIAIEEVRGTTGNDIIIGAAGAANVLSGGGGSDTLIAGGAGDTLYSNPLGTDTLVGGAGIDLGVWLEAEWDNPATVEDERSPGYSGPAVLVNVNSNGDGSVTVGGVADTLTGIEQLSFDNGIWSPVSGEWVPLIGVTDSMTEVIEAGAVDYEIDGNLVNANVVLDNAVIPLNGITLGDVEILDPDGPNGIQTVTLAGLDAASFALFDVFNPMTGETYQELRFMGGRAAGAGARTNYEIKPDYEVTLNVADGSGGSAINYRLNITDVNDNAALITSPDQIHVSDGGSTDVVVYRVTATDRDTMGAQADPTEIGGDAQGALFYDLPGATTDNDSFTLSDNGEIRFNSSPVYDGVTPANNLLQITVQAWDGGAVGVGHMTEKVVDVIINDVPEVAISPTQFIETNGQWTLRNSGSQYVIGDGGMPATEVGLTFSGSPVGPTTLAGWSAIQTEEDPLNPGGFKVLWKHTDGSYSDWTVNPAGEYVSHVYTAAGALTDPFLVNLEIDYEANLGLPLIEGVGDTWLRVDGSSHYMFGTVDSLAAELGVTFVGTPLGPNFLGVWNALHIESDPAGVNNGGPAGGYDLLWEHNDGSLSFWNLTSAGAYFSDVYTPAPVALATVQAYEVIFGADLNDDMVIGAAFAPLAVIEADGDYSLSSDGSHYQIAGPGTDIAITMGGLEVSSFGGWNAIEAEENGAGGFNVLWQNDDGSYSLWTLDGAGEYQSHVYTAADDIADPLVFDYENMFEADLDGDGIVGDPGLVV